MQRAIASRIKRQGKIVVTYRDTRGRTFNAEVTNRDSATQADIVYWRGGKRVTVANVPVFTAANMKQTGRIAHR